MLSRKRRQRSGSLAGSEAYSTRSLRGPSPGTSAATSYGGSLTTSRASSVCGDEHESDAGGGIDAEALDAAIAAAQANFISRGSPSPCAGRPPVSPTAAAHRHSFGGEGRHSFGGVDSGLQSISEVRSAQDASDSATATFFSVDGGANMGGVTTRSRRSRDPLRDPPLLPRSSPPPASAGELQGGFNRTNGSGRADDAASARRQDAGAGNPDLAKYDVLNSPFIELGSPFTAWEAVKMVLLLPLLLLRMLVILAALLFMATCSYIGGLGCAPAQPLPAWRRRIVVVGSKSTKVMLAMLGVWVHVRGWDNVERGRKEHAVVIFNHVSFLDSVVLMSMFAPSGVAKASIASWPLIGTCVSAFNTIWVAREPVNRGPSGGGSGGGGHLASANPSAATAAAKHEEPRSKAAGTSVADVAQIIKDRVCDRRYPQLCIAPEGTCSHGRCLLQFRRGAFLPGHPVLPVVLRYRWRRLNPAWTLVNEAVLAIRLVCQFVNVLDVMVLPPYMPSAAEKADALLYASNVRALYASETGWPLVEQSQREFIALCKAGVTVSLDGRRVQAPCGVLDESVCMDLSKFMRSGAKAE